MTWDVREAQWQRDGEALRHIRDVVFIQEQSVPIDLEIDGADPECAHLLAHDETGRPIGTARMLPSGKIGRMAVVRPWRGQQIGTAILFCLLEAARSQGIASVYLHAQTRALAFYAAFGFLEEGDEFEEAGIPHRLMKRRVELD